MDFSPNRSMNVIKRDGRTEEVSFDKVLERIKRSSTNLSVNPTAISQKILAQIYDGVRTTELDELTSQLAANLATVHPDYGTLAARITVSNHHKNTASSFSEVVCSLGSQVMPKTGEPISYVSEELLQIVKDHGPEIDAAIQHDRDYLFDYFGFKTLEKSYLLKDAKGKILERPQHLWMRVSLALWGSIDLKKAFQTYDLMSQKLMTHATPTLFNAGTPRQQLSSCFLLALQEDSIAGIYKTLTDCALISKYAGGIGLHCHNIRAKGSLIRGTNGMSNGLVPMLRVFNNTARYVDQCFTPDTIIYTQAGPKTIEDVNISDKVLTSNGNYENVRLPVRHEYNGKILEIQVKNAVYPVRVTPEHQVFALQGQVKGLNFDIIRNRLEKGLKQPEFVDANELLEGDFLVYPVPLYKKDIDTLSEDDCRFYGIMVGDGHISNTVSGVSLNITTKENTAKFVYNYLDNRGIKANTYQEGENDLRIKWSTTSPGFKFTRSQLYNSEKVKIIDTPFLHLPLNKVKQILRGIIESDGCIGEKEIAVEISSYPVIEAMRYILLRFGALSSGYERNRVGNVSTYKDITTRLPTAVLRIPRIPEILEMFPNAPASEYFTFLRHGNNIYSRIQSITETTYNGVVHDFEIEGPHDYTVAHLGVAHNGGGKRNGSFAMYLEPWHADVEDFLRLKLNSGTEEERARDLFYALWVSDLFMARVEADEDWTLFCPAEAPGLSDVVGKEFTALYTKYEREGRGRKTIKAQKLWFQIMDTQMETGTPYLLFKDAANLKSNQKNLGTIKSSNLCVAPETLILTDKGHVEISTLENQEVNVWNGDRWSRTTIHKTGESQRLIHVNLSNGASLHCTPYHKFLVREVYHDKSSLKNAIRVEAQNLKEGMKLAKCEFPIMEGNPSENILYPYTHGFFCGDGTTYKGKKTLSLYGEKKNIIEHLNIKSSSYIPDAVGRINTVLPDELMDKFHVPKNASLKCRLDWLAGLLDSDGCIVRNGDNESAQISSINFPFLEDIRLMLQTMGVSSKVTKMNDARITMLPDGHGGKKEFYCQPIWRILISSSALYRLGNLGLITYRLVWTIREPQRNAEQFVTVESVVDLGRVDDTYCFNEPLNHTGIFNGVLTGNCTEIIEYSDANETAVCNLASIGLPSFVEYNNNKKPLFNFDKLREVVAITVENLDRVITINFYPTPETKRSNMRHRPVGLGIQGLADVFAMMRYAWDSPEAADLNQRIAEHMYYASLYTSATLAKEKGKYETYEGSPVSKGILQPDMWNVRPLTQNDESLDWPSLREYIAENGIRNSLLIAPMPTASTSQILGYNECFEPFTSNIYSRRTLAGEFIVMNKYLLKDLVDRGLWNETMKQKILALNGSVQGISEIPEDLQNLYRTAWELKQRILIDLAAQRGAFICQSQSLNLFVADPSYAKLTSMHFYAWKQGLKTGCYYLRTKAAVTAQKFTVDPTLAAALEKEKEKEKSPDSDMKKKERRELLDKLAREYEEEQKKTDDGEGCLMCSG